MANVVFVWILMQAYVIPMFSRLTNIICCWDRGHNLRLESFQRIWDIDGQKWEKSWMSSNLSHVAGVSMREMNT